MFLDEGNMKQLDEVIMHFLLLKKEAQSTELSRTTFVADGL